MIIRSYQKTDRKQILPLIAEFRVTLASFKDIQKKPNLALAEEELDEYVVNTFPIFVAEEFFGKPSVEDKSNSAVVGYLVCRIQDDVIWAESMYVHPAYRKRGIGGMLYAEAEKIALQIGCETVYNWVHPNNVKIISFLKKRGYTALNLIEIRKPRNHEKLTQKISILNSDFDY